LEWLKNQLYPDGIKCPVCKKITRYYKIPERPSYACTICRHQISITSNTIFFKSRLPLTTWFLVIKSFIASEGKLTAKDVQRDFRMTYKTAWRIVNRIKGLHAKNKLKSFLTNPTRKAIVSNLATAALAGTQTLKEYGEPASFIGKSDTHRSIKATSIKNDRTVRLLRIQMLLCQHPQGLNIDELASKCIVSKRTIYRDLLDLESKLNVPIWQEHKNRGITDGYFLPPVNFNLEEAVDILLSVRTMQSFNYMYIPSMASTFLKLNTIIPMPLKKQITNTLSYMEKLPLYEIKIRNFNKLIDAWFSSHKVRINYQFPNELSPTEKIVEPFFIEPTLSNIGGSSYLIGYCDLKKSIYSFKINQIRGEVMIEPETYKIPDDFNIIDYLSKGLGISSSDDSIETVKLLVRPNLVEFFKGNRLHSSQTFDLQGDGSALMTLKVRDFTYFRNLILIWGNQIEVLEPDRIRNQMQDFAKSLVDIYSREKNY
jgi:predicted DNA-binding transcriptional regulator YafY